MSNLYSSLNLSPRKKRPVVDADDGSILTPKKLRTAPNPPKSAVRKGARPDTTPSLPPGIARLYTIQEALQNALSHALPTCAVSPTSDTGIVRNVLNHLSLSTYNGLRTKIQLEDLKRLCWVWEWDTQSVVRHDDDENPFLSQPKDWTRGAMGFILSPTTHFSNSMGKRVPAYGIGIEVEMDIDKDMGEGMAAVARWTAAAGVRLQAFRQKLERWIELHSESTNTPDIPLANLPSLAAQTQSSSLRRILSSTSPKASSALPSPAPPASPTPSPQKPSARHLFAAPKFLSPSVPFPSTPHSARTTFALPQTPSSRQRPSKLDELLLTPRTPRTTLPKFSLPSTPVHQRTPKAATAATPQTPSSSRREALYERVRVRSLSASPIKAKAASSGAPGEMLTPDQLMKMAQGEQRRRCQLGRLDRVAESVWMLFSSPVASTATPTSRKRRALPTSEVAQAVIKSSTVPISLADANDSLDMLADLCPFFLKKLEIAKEEWLEMPTQNSATDDVESSPRRNLLPASPGPSRGKHESAEEVLLRSPKRVQSERGGLREVREIIRKELELAE